MIEISNRRRLRKLAIRLAKRHRNYFRRFRKHSISSKIIEKMIGFKKNLLYFRDFITDECFLLSL